MNHSVLFILTILSLLWCLSHGRNPEPLLPSPLREKRTLPELVRQLKPSVVSIYVYDQKNQYLEGGSGFFISHDLVVSSRHVFWKQKRREDAYSARIRTNDRANPRVYSVKSVVLDDCETDLIVLKAPLFCAVLCTFKYGLERDTFICFFVGLTLDVCCD